MSTTPEQRAAVIAALRTVRDPELPVDIYELGLVYALDISDEGHVQIRMTLTTPACPIAGALPGQVRSAVLAVPGVRGADVELVWEPPWTPARMSSAARSVLNLAAPARRRGLTTLGGGRRS
jgi:FeS assembly SUF system protein